jgi:hypothetical protein
MPELRLLPDVESLLVTYLKADAGIAALVDQRVSTELPASFAPEGRVQLFRTGGVPDNDDIPGHLDRPSIQVNAYGETKAEAYDVAAETIRALLQAPAATHTGAVITKATRILGPTWSPDPETDTPRYLLGFTFAVHAAA